MNHETKYNKDEEKSFDHNDGAVKRNFPRTIPIIPDSVKDQLRNSNSFINFNAMLSGSSESRERKGNGIGI